MNSPQVSRLLDDLKNANETIRQQATEELWRLWFYQKGVYGLELIQRSQMLLETGDITEAEALLTELIDDQPDFAEAWNRRAVLYYVTGRYHQAAQDCEQVLELNAVHFGALHGLGLCRAALGNYREAIQAFHQALTVQPYAIENQRLILECTARLS
jgi:tetratricopeptide (TPR) repeat protein